MNYNDLEVQGGKNLSVRHIPSYPRPKVFVYSGKMVEFNKWEADHANQ